MIGIQGTQVNDDSLYMLNEYNIGGIVLLTAIWKINSK